MPRECSASVTQTFGFGLPEANAATEPSSRAAASAMASGRATAHANLKER